ncbi:MAG: hypothetical protein HKN07_01065 [Acidimicrobiia bacterium]|nr:hypothetical protein [Acidimicrobiia bacterium]
MTDTGSPPTRSGVYPPLPEERSSDTPAARDDGHVLWQTNGAAVLGR